MGLAKLFSGKRRLENDFIDLGEYVQQNGAHTESAAMYVRVAEIHKLEEVKTYADFVYKGNLLVLDFTPIAENEVTLRRVTSELKRVVQDVGGDIAGFGRNMLLVTPTSVKVERQKLKATGE